jgi:hypothetical protein
MEAHTSGECIGPHKLELSTERSDTTHGSVEMGEVQDEDKTLQEPIGRR